MIALQKTYACSIAGTGKHLYTCITHNSDCDTAILFLGVQPQFAVDRNDHQATRAWLQHLHEQLCNSYTSSPSGGEMNTTVEAGRTQYLENVSDTVRRAGCAYMDLCAQWTSQS